MVNSISKFGAALSKPLIGLGRAFTFLGRERSAPWKALLRPRWSLWLEQVWMMGVTGTPSIVFSMIFLCVVLVVELSFHMRLIVAQDAMVPSFTTMLMLRELGAVVTAMLLASRTGAAIAAEIAVMKTTRQLDALELCGIDHFEFLVVPRIFGCCVATVGLTILATSGSLVATAFLTSKHLGLTPQLFLGNLFLFSEGSDLVCCLLKAALFGTLIPCVSCLYGFNADSHSEGVGNAATRSVVVNSLGIIIADFLVSLLWYAI